MGTNKAVNKIEVHHVTMLQDLRGRIARCDNAINKHSRDIVLLMDEIKRLEAALYGTREKMLGDLHRLEAEVIGLWSTSSSPIILSCIVLVVLIFKIPILKNLQMTI